MTDNPKTNTIAELSLSAYDQFINESAEQYLQTVVLIDDRIDNRIEKKFDEGEQGKANQSIKAPPEIGRKRVLKSENPSSDQDHREFKGEDDFDEPNEGSFQEVQNEFAKKRIICSLFQPERNASFDEQSEIYKICSAADVSIIDWDLGDASGIRATNLVGSLINQSRKDVPHQLRLVLIYTLEDDLQGVANKISENLVQRCELCVDENSEKFVLKTENARVVVLGRPQNPTSQEFSENRVPESQLADRTISEFSKLASGLLQGIVLRGIARLRENNLRILTRFHKDLDIPFLIHRALLLPDQTFDQIIPLLTDEINSVLDDTLGEAPLGTGSCVKSILNDWCGKNWKEKECTKLEIDGEAKGLDFVKDVFCNGPEFQYNNFNLSHLIDEKEHGPPQWKERKVDNLVEYLLGSSPVAHCHEKLGSLMIQRVKYENTRRALHLGVIVRELDFKKRYLLCLQPICDSVRMEGTTRAFVFSTLNETTDTKRFTHCVIDAKDKVIQLEYRPKVSRVFVSNFQSDSDAVCANKDDAGRFIFKDEDENGYEWIAELKTQYAQGASEQFGRELSRVGLTESEWLRLKAKDRNG